MADYRLTQSGDEVQNILNTSTPQSELAAETERALGAEQTLQGNINAEAQARQESDTTLQGNINQVGNDLTAETNRAKAAEKANADDIDVIEGKIPVAASDQNQLADKAFVNSSIQTATAEFKGTFNEVTDLHLTISATRLQIAAVLPDVIQSADNNDYAFVQIPVADATPTVIASIERYKYNGSTWLFEYALNNSGFTQAQWDAINSTITSALVDKLSALPTNAELTTLLNGKQDVISDLSTIRSGAAAGATAVQPAELQIVSNRVTSIEGKIPAAATDQNQLADKQFVNSSIQTNTAEFKGSFNEVTDLQLTTSATRADIAAALAANISGANNNDYAFVQIPTSDTTPTVIASVERYKYNGSAWFFEYAINNSGFTQAQWDALNSGITSGLVAKLSALPTNSELTTLLAGKQDVIADLSTIRTGAAAGATAVQPSDLQTEVSTLNGTIDAEETRAKAAEKANADDIDAIEDKIPSAASDQNQLADKNFVNSSVATNTATYRGSYNLVSDLSLTISATHAQVGTALAGAINTADNNDYAFVQVPTADATPTVIASVDRYKFDGTDWTYEYTLNNSGFTAAQWASINSAITSGLVSKLSDLPTNPELNTLLAGKQAVISDLQTIRDGAAAGALAAPQSTTYTKTEVNNLVNSSVATATATYRGSFNLVSDLSLTIDATEQQIATALATAIVTADNNDYAFVQIPAATATPTVIASVDRYKFDGTDWTYEYTLNNSGFTAAQWASINSAITSGLVSKLSDLPTNPELNTLLAGKQAVISDLQTIRDGAAAGALAAPQSTTYTKTEVNNLVNSSVATATATYRGSFNLVSDLSLTIDATEQQIATALATAIVTADNNDYAFVQIPAATATPTVIASVDRYKFNGTEWSFEYRLNNSGFTQAQWDAINSGITSGLVAKLSALPTNADLQTALLGKQAVISDLADIRAGAGLGATAYQKPVGGIPDTDLTAALQAQIASFITASVNNLVNYYLKSETYSAAQIDALIAAVKQFRYEAVTTLPTASASTMGTIYLVPGSSSQQQNVKDEYITLSIDEGGTTTYYWEMIGQTTIDLSNYYTKSQTDSAITAAINTALASYSTTSAVSTMISTAVNSALEAYATKDYVSGQVQEYAGTFRGTFDTLADLEATTGNHHNDYAWVKVTDSDGDNDYDRYKYNGSAWVFEYRLNNTHFTAAELDSIRSGMTTAKREKLDALPTNNDLTTKINSLTRRTRLTDFDLSVLKQAVADQNLEKYGLKVGDYKTINGRDYVIAGLNPMKGVSTPYRVTANHVGLIVIPHTTQAWNASGNTSTGANSRGAGYKNSDLHYYLKNTLLPLVNTDLGADNLIGHSKLLTKAVNTTGYNRYGSNTGCSSNWDWEADCKICALSEVQVYGSIVWSSSGFDTGEACRQLDVFRVYNHTEIFGDEYPWLRDVVSASFAAYADRIGLAHYSTASDASYVAALILFN